MLSELRAISSGPLPALRHRGLAQDRARGEAPASSIPTSPPMSCPVAAGLEGDRARSPQGLAPPPRQLPRSRPPPAPRPRPPPRPSPVRRPRRRRPRPSPEALAPPRPHSSPRCGEGEGVGRSRRFLGSSNSALAGGGEGVGRTTGARAAGPAAGPAARQEVSGAEGGGGVAGARGGQGAYVGFIRAVGYPYFCRAAPVSASGGRRGEWRRGRPRRGGRSGPATTRARGRGCWRCP